MSKPLTVRIGITTKNRPDYLPRCLSSCLAQTYPHKDIVVWDNSDDAEAIRRIDALAKQFPEVLWLRTETKKSLIDARTEMMSEPGYDLFCCVDDDAWFIQGDEIAIAVKLFGDDANLAGVGFDILSPDRSEAVPRAAPRSAMCYVGCGHMLRRSMASQVGFYAQFPGAYGSEEKDLCIRFMDLGLSMLFLPGVHVWHDKTAGQRDWAAQHRSGTLNDMIFALVRCPMPDLVYYLPGKAAHLVLWGMKGGKTERWSGALGLWDFFRYAPEYWKKRHPVSRKTFLKFFRAGRSTSDQPRDWSGRER